MAGFEYIECPVCDKKAIVTYEENRLYRCSCLSENCQTVFEIEKGSFIDAVKHFKSIKIPYESRVQTRPRNMEYFNLNKAELIRHAWLMDEHLDRIQTELNAFRSLGSLETVQKWAQTERNGQVLNWIEADTESPDIGDEVLIYPIDGKVVTAEYYGEGEYVYNGHVVLGQYIEQWAHTPKPRKGDKK